MSIAISLVSAVHVCLLIVVVVRYQSLFESYYEKALLGLFAFSIVAGQLLRFVFSEVVTIDDSKTQLIVETLAVGGPLLGILGLALVALVTRSRRFVVGIYRYEMLIALLGLYNLLTFVIGVAMGNNLSHLLADTYKLVVFPLGYLAVLIVVDRDRVFEWFRAVYALVIVSVLSVFGKQMLSLVIGPFEEFNAGLAVFYLVPLLLLTLSTPEARNPLPGSRTAQFALLIVSLASILLSLGRGDWIVTACVLSTFFVISSRRWTLARPLKRPTGALLMGTVGIALLVKGQSLLALIRSKTIGIRRDIAKMEEFFAYERRARGSLAQKVAEGLDVLKHMTERGSPFHYLFGFGNGAEYQTVISKVSSTGMNVYGGPNHQIHNFLFAQLFRRGIFGVVLGVWLFLSAILAYFEAWVQATDDTRALFGAVFLTIVAVFVKLMSVAATFFDARVIMFLGLAGVLLRTIEWTDEQQAGTETKES